MPTPASLLINDPMCELAETSRHPPNIDESFGRTDLSSTDCRSCGACCVEAGAVDLTCHDDVPDSMVVEDDLCFRWLKTEAGSTRCVALNGTVGHSVRCSIYERRPETCRAFDRGDQACFSARARMRTKMSDPAGAHGYEMRHLCSSD